MKQPWAIRLSSLAALAKHPFTRRLSMKTKICRVLTGTMVAAVLAGVGVSLQGMTAWNTGDVFVAIGGGQYRVYSNSGVLKETIQQKDLSGTDFTGFTTGCAFDSNGDLYTTNFSNTKVIKFAGPSPHPVLQVVDTSVQSPGGDSESIVFAANGNFYVGHPDGDHDVHRYNAAGMFQQKFDVGIEAGGRGSDWIDLAIDQSTLFYTSEGRLIRRYNVATGIQLADFATLPDDGDESSTDLIAFGLRLLPPWDGSGGLLVADKENIKRLNGSGAVAQTYDVAATEVTPGENDWFSLNLDPNGTSFWAANRSNGNVYRFNISTGVVEVTINTGVSLGGGTGVTGICIKGEQSAPLGTESGEFTYNSGSPSHTFLFDSGNVGYKLSFPQVFAPGYTLRIAATYIDALPEWATNAFPGCQLIRMARPVAGTSTRGVSFRVDPVPPPDPQPNVDYTPPYSLYLSSFSNWLSSGADVCRVRLLHHRNDTGGVTDIFTGFFPEGTPDSDPGAGGSDDVFGSEYLVCDDPPASPLGVMWILPKPDNSSMFKTGRTVPFQLALSDSTVADAVCRLTVTKLSDTTGGSELVETEASGLSNTDNLFRRADGRYIYNLSLKGYLAGTYEATVSCDTSCNASVQFSVVPK
jgi:hypothetical protein